MISLLEILQEAEAANTGEIRIVSGQKPMTKNLNGWHPMEHEALTSSFVKDQLFHFLDEDERSEFLQKGMISGALLVNDQSFSYVFSIAEQGMNAYFSWKNPHVGLHQFSLPPALFEIYKKTAGVHLVTGPRLSGKTTLVQLLGQTIADENKRSVAIFADRADEYAQGSNDGTWQVFPVEHLTMAPQLLRGYDFVIIDSHRAQAWRHGLQFGEIGGKVVIVLPFMSTPVAMERFSEKLENTVDIGRRRIAETLQTAISLRLVPALDSGKQAAYELLLMTKEIRQAVVASDWSQVESLMGAVAENSGMRTLNQCLMNLMMRRKIDVKAGFAESPRPEELNLMLEKVGF